MDPQLYIVGATALGNVIGWFLKRSPKVQNAFIPAVMIFIMLLKNVFIGAHLLPDGATTIDLSQFQGEGAKAVLFAITTAMDSALPIGIHSAVKNLGQIKYTSKGVTRG